MGRGHEKEAPGSGAEVESAAEERMRSTVYSLVGAISYTEPLSLLELLFCCKEKSKHGAQELSVTMLTVLLNLKLF